MTVGPDPGVFISSAQMYQELRTLSDGITRVETKLDTISKDLTEVTKDLTDHETRIRSLEQTVWRAAGGGRRRRPRRGRRHPRPIPDALTAAPPSGRAGPLHHVGDQPRTGISPAR